VKFTERKEWTYDQEIFKRSDVQTALRIHNEYVRRASPVPPPRFLECNRDQSNVDALWHFPLNDRTVFDRQIDMQCIVQFERPDWRMTKIGLVPKQKCKFWVDHLLMQELDYFPTRGDFVYFNGYRNLIVNVVLEPNGYWQQTNIWLGFIVETIIPADGDARPVQDPSRAVPDERIQTKPVPYTDASYYAVPGEIPNV
jgi:hypothetical protein